MSTELDACPQCESAAFELVVSVGQRAGGEIRTFRCPDCNYEWSVERSA